MQLIRLSGGGLMRSGEVDEWGCRCCIVFGLYPREEGAIIVVVRLGLPELWSMGFSPFLSTQLLSYRRVLLVLCLKLRIFSVFLNEK